MTESTEQGNGPLSGPFTFCPNCHKTNGRVSGFGFCTEHKLFWNSGCTSLSTEIAAGLEGYTKVSPWFLGMGPGITLNEAKKLAR